MAPRAQKPDGTSDHFTDAPRASARRSRFGGAVGGPDPDSPSVRSRGTADPVAEAREDGSISRLSAEISASVTTRRDLRFPLHICRGVGLAASNLESSVRGVTVRRPYA